MRRILLGLVLLALACKGSGGSSQDVVLVQVNAPGLDGITHLNVTFTNNGASATRSYPETATSAPIAFPTNLSATMPSSRTGTIDVSIDGLDAQNTITARGHNSNDLVSGGQDDITVTLAAFRPGTGGNSGQGGATATGGATAGAGGGATATGGGTGGAGGAKGGATGAGGGPSTGTGGTGGAKGGATGAGGGPSTGTGGTAAVGGGAAGIDAGVAGANGGSGGTSAQAGSGGGSSGASAAGGSGGTIRTGGIGAGGTGGTGGGTGGTSACTPIACPAIACAGQTQPNPDPCGCPICAPTLDGGAPQDTGGSGDRASTDANSAETPATCSAPKSTGGIVCPGHFCTVGTYSGWAFTYPDASGQSAVCLATNSLCIAGTTGVADPPAYTVWGAGFGVSLSPSGTAVQLSGTGVTVALTSLPTGAVTVGVNLGTTGYCAVITAATQTIPWSSFNTTCYAPATGVALTGPPNTANITFNVTSGPTVGTFDFCVTALSFQ